MKSVLTVLACAAALALATSARADVGTVTPLEVTNIQALSGDQVPGAVIYNNTTSSGFYYPPPAGAVPVEMGTAVVVTSGSPLWHVNNFSFGYATTQLDSGSGVIEVVINFYGSLAGDDSPDTVSGPVASFDIPNLPGSPDGTTTAGWLYGPVDLTAAGLDFDWAPSTFAFDGVTQGNWVTFTYQQTSTGPILCSGETILNAFWTGTDLNAPYESGSFFWNFGGQAPPAFYLQIGGTAQ